MRVRFWGVRGSCPAPVTSRDLTARIEAALLEYGKSHEPPDLSDPEAVSAFVSQLSPGIGEFVGGNTPCVEMRTSTGDIFILDLGTGVRALGNALMDEGFGKGEGFAHVFLSHFHWDHIQGWPFFRPVYVKGNRFDMYTRHEHIHERLHAQQTPPFFPAASWDDIQADVRYFGMTDEPIELCEGRVKVTTLELDHPSRAWAYRFETDSHVFVYASDGAYYNLTPETIQPFVDFYRDADLLVFDAQFTLMESFEKRTWGHSSPIVGVELACMAGVKKLALFHHDPNSDDAALEHLLCVARQYARNIPCEKLEVILAREGLTIEL